MRQVDARTTAIAGVGFHVTPFARADALTDALGFAADGGVWVKDETGQVAGSHKARHLFTILLHLLAAESWASRRGRRGGAAAARHRVVRQCRVRGGDAGCSEPHWPIEVFVPP